SFVQPRFQGMRALDYLWQGIGAYLVTRPDVRYLFGPVSLSAAYPELARRMLVNFFARHYGGDGTFATARLPIDVDRGADGPADLVGLKEGSSALAAPIPFFSNHSAKLCEPGVTPFVPFTIDPSFATCIAALVPAALRPANPARPERYLAPRGEIA